MQFSKLKKLLIRYLTDTNRFLYIVGIQTVRIIKRVNRRLSRFLKPVTDLLGHFYTITVGRQIRNLKKEIQLIHEGIEIAAGRIREARKIGFGRTFITYFWVAGKSFTRHKEFLCSIFNVLAPAGAIVLLFLTVKYWTGLNYGLVLSYDGQQVATIQNEKIYEQATEMVSQRMVHDTVASDIGVKYTPSFQLSVVDPSKYSPVSFVCDKIIQQSNGIIEEASGLYVDGQLMGAVKSSADLRFILQNILNKARGSDTDATTTFSQDVETITGLFPTTTIMTTDAMNKLVSGTTKSAVTYTVKEGDTVTSIAKANNTTIAELNKINNNQLGDNLHPGDLITMQVPTSLLSVQKMRSMIYRVPLSYKTVTIPDDSQYTDYSKVKNEGVNGVQECTDKIYYLNGLESKREIVKRTVVIPSVDKVVITGTKKRPKINDLGESTGNFMWPVPSLHTITTYFTWRWGSFHTGIDISGGGAYGKTIVAADGGVVVSAGWRNGYGNCVQIRHSSGVQTLYGHASKILVTSGQKVSKGQAIARVGSTGNSTGPHLHFEVIKNGTRVNPLGYVGR